MTEDAKLIQQWLKHHKPTKVADGSARGADHIEAWAIRRMNGKFGVKEKKSVKKRWDKKTIQKKVYSAFPPKHYYEIKR
jgi:hypothetical protein